MLALSGVSIKGKVLSKYFDHTMLKPETTVEQIRNLCQEALHYNFASVCVNSSHVELVSELLKGSNVKVCAVVGFPLGAMATAVKVAETLYCHEKGANEIDMVINIGYLKSREFDIVRNDILRVVEVCHQRNMMCKVILEVCLLEEEEKAIAATIAVECGADYIKTSTGFSNGGAVLNDIRLMASIAHEKGAFVKASGGIRDGYFATSLIEAGADRLGTSATVKVYEECLNIIHKAHEAAIAQQAHLS